MQPAAPFQGGPALLEITDLHVHEAARASATWRMFPGATGRRGTFSEGLLKSAGGNESII